MLSDGGDAAEEHSTVVDMAATDEDDVVKAPLTMNNSYIISAIPYMPRSVATLCLVLNVIVPGSGDVTRPTLRSIRTLHG